MKWNIFVGSLVLGLGLNTQSFGFELLDRMLGISGCGCETKCCETKGKGCDAKAAGCEEKAAACGADKKADCGCNAKAKSSCRKPLLSGLFACNRGNKKGCDDKGCDAKADGCEAKAAACGADKGCDAKKSCSRRGLLDRIFSCNRCNKGCADKGCDTKAASCGCGAKAAGCGCGAGGEKSKGEDMAPVPPAPVVDPTAFIQSQRRVVVR